MKKILGVLLLCLAGLSWAKLQPESSLQLDLAPGQALKLELSAGDYRIAPGQSGRVVVISQSQNSHKTKPRFGVDISPTEASVKVNAPEDYVALIEVPETSNLKVHLNGGRLQVNGVNGDKDIESNAGVVTIDMGKPENYGRVEASVDMGHIEAAPYDVVQEGSARSFQRQGPGSYRLHAHVGTGEIRLVASETESSY